MIREDVGRYPGSEQPVAVRKGKDKEGKQEERANLEDDECRSLPLYIPGRPYPHPPKAEHDDRQRVKNRIPLSHIRKENGFSEKLEFNVEVTEEKGHCRIVGVFEGIPCRG